MLDYFLQLITTFDSWLAKGNPAINHAHSDSIFGCTGPDATHDNAAVGRMNYTIYLVPRSCLYSQLRSRLLVLCKNT